MVQTEKSQTGASSDYFELDLRKVRALIKNSLWAYVFSTMVVGIIAYLYSYTISPAFRSVSIVTTASGKSQQGALGALANQLGPLTSLLSSDMFSSEDTQVTIAILESRKFTEDFILGNDLLDELTGFSTEELKAMPDGELERAKWTAFKVFSESVRNVEVDVRSGLINVSIIWEEPKKGAMLNNAMIYDLNLHLRDTAIKESERSLDYLSGQLGNTTNTELRSALVSLIDKEMKSAMMANVREDYALNVIDPAVPAVSKYSPKRRNFALLGLLLGFLASMLHVVYKLAKDTSAENR